MARLPKATAEISEAMVQRCVFRSLAERVTALEALHN